MREKIKEQKGAVTLFVVVACMFMITVLLLINIGIMNKNASEEKEIARISKNYAVGETDLLNSYNKIANENGYPNYEEVQNMIEEAVNKAKEETRTEMNKEIEDVRGILNDTIKNIETEINKAVETAKSETKLEAFPVGSIYIGTTPTSPSDFIGGTWESYGQGRTLIGAGTGVDSNNVQKIFNVDAIGGNYINKLTIAQMPSHNHTITPTGTIASTFIGNTVNTSTIGNHDHATATTRVANIMKLDDATLLWGVDRYNTTAPRVGSGLANSGREIYFDIPALYVNPAGSHNHSVTPAGTVTSRFTGAKGTTSSVGEGSEINNVQPYIVTYMWKRIA